MRDLGCCVAVSLALLCGCSLPQRIHPAQVTASAGSRCFVAREPALFYRQVDTCPVFAAKPTPTRWRLWLEPSADDIRGLNSKIVDLENRSCDRRALLDDVRQVAGAHLLIDVIETQRYYWMGTTWRAPLVPHHRTIIRGRAYIDGSEQEFETVHDDVPNVPHLMQRYFDPCDAPISSNAAP